MSCVSSLTVMLNIAGSRMYGSPTRHLKNNEGCRVQVSREHRHRNRHVIDCPIMLKLLLSFTVMCVLMHAFRPCYAQTGTDAVGTRNEFRNDPTPSEGLISATHSSIVKQGAGRPAQIYGTVSDPAKYPQPNIKVVDPPAVVSDWPLHERITWAANLMLAVFGYAGIVIALRALNTVKRQMNSIESVAQAAIECANSATTCTRAIINTQRPWILMKAERSHETPNSFDILATNHGPIPAEIIDCPDQVRLVSGERHLPIDIADVIERCDVLESPVMLFPGESSVLQRFGRGDVNWICKTEDSLRGVRSSEQTILILGTVKYRGLNLFASKDDYKTDWCFRYVHGENTSDLVMGGPLRYNRHT
jgi:hypothetical protein